MASVELSRPMRVLVEDISEIGPGDTALVLTDDTRRDIARALAGAIRAADATAGVLIIPYEDRGGVEPPAMAAAAMARSDYVFILTSNNLTHTDAHRAAQKAGTQISSMWGITEDTFINGPSPENYERVDELIRQLVDRLDGTSEVHITTDAGTDIRFEVTGRPPIALGIKESDKSTAADFPQGEVAIAPVEGTANGQMVVDVGIDVVGLVETPIEIEFRDGHAVSIEGGTEAAMLRRMVDEADENATNLAEFAIGTNEDARLIDHIREAKKKLGTIHLAIGDSNTIGGTVKSDLHVDCILADPTVSFDGTVIMERGKIQF